MGNNNESKKRSRGERIIVECSQQLGCVGHKSGRAGQGDERVVREWGHPVEPKGVVALKEGIDEATGSNVRQRTTNIKERNKK